MDVSENETNPLNSSCPPGVLQSGLVNVFDWVHWLQCGPFTVIVCLMGSAGNAYALNMIAHFRIRITVRWLLGAMALWDCLLCAWSLPYFAFNELLTPFIGQSIVLNSLQTYVHAISNMNMLTSIWMLVTITCERYRALAAPLKHRSLDTPKRAKCICMIIPIISGLYCVPGFFELTVISCNNGLASATFVDATDLRRHALYQTLYHVVGNSLFITIGPFILITVVTGLMLLVVRRARAQRQQQMHASTTNGGNSTKRSEHTTLMLIVIAFKFLIFYALLLILNLWERVNPASVVSPVYILFTDLSNTCVIFNSASNCIVYFRWRATLHARETRNKNTAVQSHSKLKQRVNNESVCFSSTMSGRDRSNTLQPTANKHHRRRTTHTNEQRQRDGTRSSFRGQPVRASDRRLAASTTEPTSFSAAHNQIELKYMDIDNHASPSNTDNHASPSNTDNQASPSNTKTKNQDSNIDIEVSSRDRSPKSTVVVIRRSQQLHGLMPSDV